MKKSILKLALFCFLATSVIVSCKKKDDPAPEVPKEGITDAVFVFTNKTDASNKVTITLYDPDLEGGIAPTVTVAGTLKKGATYSYSCTKVYNSLAATNERDVLEEIKVILPQEHQFYFGFPNTLFETFSYKDTDPDGKPLGLEAELKVPANATSGSLNIRLNHLGDKTKNNATTPWVYNSNIGGDADLDLQVTLQVQ
jgi:hypothetical protein